MTSSYPCDKDKSLWRHRREIPPQKGAKFNLYCTTNNVAQKETLAYIFSTVCGSVVDHYHIGVEIHQITQTHKKVNKIHLKKDACIYIKETHQPKWLHFYSDSDSLIWSKKEIFDLPYPKHWHNLDHILTRRTTHSPHSSDYDTDRSLMRDDKYLLKGVMKFWRHKQFISVSLSVQTISFWLNHSANNYVLATQWPPLTIYGWLRLFFHTSVVRSYN